MMQTKKLILAIPVIVLFLILPSCDDNDEPVPLETKLLLDFEVAASFENSGNWIFISNKQGKIISYKAFEPGDKFTLEGDVEKGTDEICVTVLYNAPAFGVTPELFSIYSFTDIAIGSKWSIPGYTLPITTGSANIPLTNLPAPSTAISSSLDGTFPDTFSLISSQETVRVSARNEPMDFFIGIIGQESPKYAMVENVTTNKVIPSLNYTTDFNDFDHTLLISVSQPVKFSTSISGFQSEFNQTSSLDSKYHVFYRNQTEQFALASFVVGFNDGYKFYSTAWTAAQEKNSTSYYKIGSAPESADFIIPEYDVTLLNKEINNFRFNTSNDFEFARGFWSSPPIPQFGSVFSWRVSSMTGTNQPIISAFPQEFISQNPTFEDLLNSAIFRDAYFYDIKSGYSYQDHIDESFIPQFPLHQWEYYFFIKSE
jgi:hypothetical protein